MTELWRAAELRAHANPNQLVRPQGVVHDQGACAYHRRGIAMPSIYPKSTKELFKEFVDSFVPPPPTGFGLDQRKSLTEGGYFTRKEVLAWFQKNYPKIKHATVTAHLIRLSVNAPSRIHYGAKPGDDDLFFQMDSRHFRLYDESKDPAPIYEKGEAATVSSTEIPEEPEGPNEFAYESDLREFLAKNLSLIEPGLHLYQEEGITGVEFPAGGRFIDILAVDSQNNLVVIELKVSRGYDRVVGQLLRYMGWISKYHAEPTQQVRGIIVAREITEDLLLACSPLTGVKLYEYKLSVDLHPKQLG
jgi:endonuclease